ncbi:MAG: DUF1622 domain-containing protein [Rubrobacter sp.]|jgi:uncharacterized membrane protein|nr:DUF1622 domain-containing protein [Rubrobacter sp.]
MDLYHALVNILRMSLLLAGSVVIFTGIAWAALEALRAGSSRPFARRMTSQVALGLEFFIGATILNLVLNPTWAAAQMTILTIVVRQLVTLSFGSLARKGV